MYLRMNVLYVLITHSCVCKIRELKLMVTVHNVHIEISMVGRIFKIFVKATPGDNMFSTFQRI